MDLGHGKKNLQGEIITIKPYLPRSILVLDKLIIVMLQDHNVIIKRDDQDPNIIASCFVGVVQNLGWLMYGPVFRLKFSMLYMFSTV